MSVFIMAGFIVELQKDLPDCQIDMSELCENIVMKNGKELYRIGLSLKIKEGDIEIKTSTMEIITKILAFRAKTLTMFGD